MRELWLAFEGGGSTMRAFLADRTFVADRSSSEDADNAVIAREYAGPTNTLVVRHGTFVGDVRALLGRIARHAKRAKGRIVLAGLSGPGDLQVVSELIEEQWGPIERITIGEADLSLMAHDLDWGISLIAGTGVTCRCRDEAGHDTTCGGFGWQFGDDGGGYWIGRAAVAAAACAEDGRGPSTCLLERMLAFFGISRRWDILLHNVDGIVPVHRVGAFAREVFAAAGEGDAVARRICRDAGRALGQVVLATARRAKISRGPIPVAATGGVFHGGKLIVGPMQRALRSGDVSFHVCPPIVEPTSAIFKALARKMNGT